MVRKSTSKSALPHRKLSCQVSVQDHMNHVASEKIYQVQWDTMSTAIRPVLIVRPAVLKCSLLYSCRSWRKFTPEPLFTVWCNSKHVSAAHLSGECYIDVHQDGCKKGEEGTKTNHNSPTGGLQHTAQAEASALVHCTAFAAILVGSMRTSCHPRSHVPPLILP